MRLSNRVAPVTGTAVDDVANAPLSFAAFEFNALSGPSLVVSHGWFMQ